jgi:GNAT superfamily N-acetyltransferase
VSRAAIIDLRDGVADELHRSQETVLLRARVTEDAVVRIRLATAADAEAIERIRIRGWRVAYRHVFPPEQLDAMPIDWSRWLEWLTQPSPARCFVAEDEAGLLGFATVGPSAFPDRFGELHGLYVDPDRWGEGAGRALLARAEDELAETWDEAILWTLEDNLRTRRFYEAAGWHLDGTTGSFERLGVSAAIVRYAKRLSKSASRS